MLPSAWVFAHFLKGSDTSRRILSSSKIAQAAAEFSRPESLRDRYLGLDNCDQLRCALAYLTGDTGLVLEQEPFADPLVLSFLVYAAKNQSGTIRIFGFDEFESSLRPYMIRTLLDNAAESVESQPVTTWVWRMLNDITVIAGLGFQGQLKKKKTGGLTRTASSQIKKLTNAGSLLKSESGDNVSRLGIAYCRNRKILYETEHGFLFSQPAFRSWLAESPDQRYKDMVEFTFRYSGGWRQEMLHALINNRSGKWIKTSVFPEQDRQQAINTLLALRFSGVLELRKKGTGLVFGKPRFIGPDDISKTEIAVPADFTVIIPQEADSSDLFSFMQAGELGTLDRVYKGRIEKKIIADSLSRGVTGESILQWLTEWNAPVNVIETVREWLREFYRLYITERDLLVSGEKKITGQIESYEPLRSLLEPLSADAVYLIKRGNENRVREILAGLGFDYRMPGQDQFPAVPEAALSSDQSPVQEFYPLTQPDSEKPEPSVQMRNTKYGRELKQLETSEMLHVVDYAILTGQLLVFEYEGSPYIKKNTYVVDPISCQKGVEPIVEGEVSPGRSKKQFYLKRISRIGVLPK